MSAIRPPLEVVVEPPEVWESEILEYQERDRVDPPLQGGVVFVGSSTIRMWTTLARDFDPLPVVNRGFGGAQMDAVLHYATRLVIPHQPRVVVVYAGENDLEPVRGKTPERVLGDFRSFVSLVGAAVPGVHFYILSMKPSPARTESWPAVKRLSELLRDFCDGSSNCTLVDMETPTLGEHGQTRQELFLSDGLHLSRKGYAVWTAQVRPVLWTDPALEPFLA